MRDTIKTVAGLVIIVVIVVATFVYGNAQRQNQLKHDQQVKQQQQAAANSQLAKASPSASVKASTTAAPSVKPTVASTPVPSSKPTSNTAPVQSPVPNTVQGSKASSPAPPAGQVAGAQTVPVTGGSSVPLPQTGASLGSLVGLMAVIFAVVTLRRSRQAIVAAARSRR